MKHWFAGSLVLAFLAVLLGCSQKEKIAAMERQEETQRAEIDANQKKIEEMKKQQQF